MYKITIWHAYCIRKVMTKQLDNIITCVVILGFGLLINIVMST